MSNPQRIPFKYLQKAKLELGRSLMPVVRQYVKYSPLALGKAQLLKHFIGRESMRRSRAYFGLKMNLNTKDLIQGRIYWFGVWEPNLSAFIENRLSEDKRRSFVDVGANVGYFSLLASHILTAGKVVAIEPFPSIYGRLRENIALNNCANIRAVNQAVCDCPRDVPLYFSGSNNEGRTTSVPGIFKSDPVIVAGEALDNILSDEEVKTVRLIKIDVEGAEYSVLKGLFRILDHFPEDVEFVVEITPGVIDEKQMQEIFFVFSEAGFWPYRLRNDYSLKYYLSPLLDTRLPRMYGPPDSQVDVVFSRQQRDELPMDAQRYAA